MDIDIYLLRRKLADELIPCLDFVSDNFDDRDAYIYALTLLDFLGILSDCTGVDFFHHFKDCDLLNNIR